VLPAESFEEEKRRVPIEKFFVEIGFFDKLDLNTKERHVLLVIIIAIAIAIKRKIWLFRRKPCEFNVKAILFISYSGANSELRISIL